MTDLFQDEQKDYLSELVGEGKKFKTPADLAKGKFEADHFIEILKKQQDSLREDYNKLKADYEARDRFEDLVDQMQNRKNDDNSKPPTAEVRDNTLDVNQFKDIATKTYAELQSKAKEEANAQLVLDALKERYGSNYSEHLNKQVEELGFTKEAVNYMARTSPKALLKTLGVEQQRTETFQAPPRSSTFQPTGVAKRTWSYYEKMKKDNPTEFYSPKTTIQMEKDYMALGPEFEDGNFRAYGTPSAFI